jgi:hypothetical protein
LGADIELKIWHDAHSMMAECDAYFGSAVLISLDHDLNPRPGASADPGMDWRSHGSWGISSQFARCLSTPRIRIVPGLCTTNCVSPDGRWTGSGL